MLNEGLMKPPIYSRARWCYNSANSNFSKYDQHLLE
jgi:hypothetical protein